MKKSENAEILWEKANAHISKQIVVWRPLDGSATISIGGESVSDGTYESFLTWESALQELVNNGRAKDVNSGKIFVIQ